MKLLPIKILISLLTILIASLSFAQKEEIRQLAKTHEIPLQYYHPTNIKSLTETQFEETLEILNKMENSELENFMNTVTKKRGQELITGNNLKSMVGFYLDKKIKYPIFLKINGDEMKITRDGIKTVLQDELNKLAEVGEVTEALGPKKEIASNEVKQTPKTVEEKKPQIDCQAELNKSLDNYLQENREELIKAQFRITSLKLAQKTRGSNKKTLEELVKTEKSNLSNIKNSEESLKELKNLYRAYGIEDDTKIIGEIESLSNKSSQLNYYKGTQRLLNEDLSAYIMANVADSKNTLFDESDAATAWLFDEIQKKYLSMGNKKFTEEFNLMNLSSASFLLNNGIDKEGKPTDINQSLSDSEKYFTEAYNRFLTQFKEEKKICFESGSAFEGECDEELLGLIEKGFAGDLQKLVKELKSEKIKPEFNIGHLKIADSEISFNDLMAADISKIKSNTPTVKRETSSNKSTTNPKQVTEKDFESQVNKAFVSSPPFSNFLSPYGMNDYKTKIGMCEIKIFKRFDGSTRVEMYSPRNKMSYNMTFNTRLLTNNISNRKIASELNRNYNKPHIRESCLAN